MRHLSPQQRLDLELYAINDVSTTFAVAAKLLPELSRPGVELRAMAHTTLLHNARGFPLGGIEAVAAPQLGHHRLQLVHLQRRQLLARQSFGRFVKVVHMRFTVIEWKVGGAANCG